MSFDWSEFLALAKALQSSLYASSFPEAAQRSAVSRAYYAAFCYLRHYAENQWEFQRTRTAQDHERLRRHLRYLTGQGSSWDELVENLGDFRQWRNQCDYDDDVRNLDVMLSTAITTAEKLIEACR